MESFFCVNFLRIFTYFFLKLRMSRGAKRMSYYSYGGKPKSFQEAADYIVSVHSQFEEHLNILEYP